MWDFITSLSTWAYAPFTIPLFLVFIVAILQTIGVGLEGLLGVDAPDVDLHSGGHVEVGADAGPHLDATDLQVHHGLLVSSLGFFHVGKVPFGFILSVLLATFGLAGIAFLKFALPEWLPAAGTGTTLLIAVPGALCSSVLFTKAITSILARVAPADGVATVRLRDLAGRVGTVISAQVDSQGGRVEVRDDSGESHQVHCRLTDGGPAVPKGAPLLLVAYDTRENVFRATAAPVGVR